MRVFRPPSSSAFVENAISFRALGQEMFRVARYSAFIGILSRGALVLCDRVPGIS